MRSSRVESVRGKLSRRQPPPSKWIILLLQFLGLFSLFGVGYTSSTVTVKSKAGFNGVRTTPATTTTLANTPLRNIEDENGKSKVGSEKFNFLFFPNL